MSLRAAENYVRRSLPMQRIVADAMTLQIVELGAAMMSENSGLHFTFIDPRRTSTDQITKQAMRMTERFKEKNVDTSRVIFSVRIDQCPRAETATSRVHFANAILSSSPPRPTESTPWILWKARESARTLPT